MSKVLQIQPGSVLIGGIASYVQSIVRSDGLNQFIIMGPGASECSVNFPCLYNASAYVETPLRYGFCGLVAYIRKLRFIVKYYDVNIIHAHALRAALPAAILSLLTGVKFLYTNHGLRFTQKNSLSLKFIFYILEMVVVYLSKYTICIRRCDFDYLRANKHFLNNRLKYITTRIDFDFDLNNRDKCVIENLNLVTVGSMEDVKNPMGFIKCVEYLRRLDIPINAVMVGDGPLYDQLYRYVKINSLPIRLVGRKTSRQVYEILKRSHLYLLTSNFEVMPIAVLEAFSCKLPVIASYYDGVTELVVNGSNGFLVDIDSEHSVVSAVSSILKNYDFYSRNAYDFYFKNHKAVKIMSDEYCLLYH